ncbi:unnamed protein product, partial [Chrysoparadoxa australica]
MRWVSTVVASSKHFNLLHCLKLSVDTSPIYSKRHIHRGALTPFFMLLNKVEGWQIPTTLLSKIRRSCNKLSYSLSMSFYHAGSRRFYGNTFNGDTISEDDSDRVIRNEDGYARPRKQNKKKDKEKEKAREKGKGAQKQKRRGSNSSKWDEEEGDEEPDDLDLSTVHKDVVYWCSSYEDPNCLAVLELVATEVDEASGMEVGKYGCGWTFIQLFGPNDPEAQTQRDVYRGSPRNLLFFEERDFQRVGETAIPGCVLWFRMEIFDKLLAAKHLFSTDEIVSASDEVAGLAHRQLIVPYQDEPLSGPSLGYRLEELGTKRNRQSEPVPQ